MLLKYINPIFDLVDEYERCRIVQINIWVPDSTISGKLNSNDSPRFCSGFTFLELKFINFEEILFTIKLNSKFKL